MITFLRVVIFFGFFVLFVNGTTSEEKEKLKMEKKEFLAMAVKMVKEIAGALVMPKMKPPPAEEEKSEEMMEEKKKNLQLPPNWPLWVLYLTFQILLIPLVTVLMFAKLAKLFPMMEAVGNQMMGQLDWTDEKWPETTFADHQSVPINQSIWSNVSPQASETKWTSNAPSQHRMQSIGYRVDALARNILPKMHRKPKNWNTIRLQQYNQFRHQQLKQHHQKAHQMVPIFIEKSPELLENHSIVKRNVTLN